MLQARQKILRRFWYPVMPTARLASGPQPFRLMSEDLVLFNDAAGRPVALQDRCVHRTAKLSKGWVDEGRLVCGYHGWTYDTTGRVVRIPQYTTEQIPGNSQVKAFHAAAKYGYVWVALEDPLAPIPEFEEAADPSFRQIDQFYEVWKCAGLRLMENSFDMAHISFVHRQSFGILEEPKTDLMTITEQKYGLETYVEVPVKNADEIAARVTGTAGGRTVRTMRGKWYMPFTRRLGIVYPNGLKHSIITNATPIDDESSMIVQWTYRNDREEDVAAADIIAFDRQVTAEDKEVLEGTNPDACVDTTRRVEFHMTTDKPGLVMRQKLLALMREHGEEEIHR